MFWKRDPILNHFQSLTHAFSMRECHHASGFKTEGFGVMVPRGLGSNQSAIVNGELILIFRRWPKRLGSGPSLLHEVGMDLAEQ